MGDVTYDVKGSNGMITINLDKKFSSDVTKQKTGNDNDADEKNDIRCNDDTPKLRDVDSGWAWMVMLASCMILALVDVFLVLAGIFQLDFLETFGGSRAFLALIGSFFVCSAGVLGPVSGVLSGRLTPRVTIMAGGVLMSLGLMAASFAQSRWTLLLTYGIINGLGAGLVYTPAATAYMLYFDKYRQIAIGFVMGAPGIGSLAGPYLARWFLDAYGWRYSMSICGCLAAQLCVLGAMFFPMMSGKQTTPTLTCLRICRARRRRSNFSDKSQKFRNNDEASPQQANEALLEESATPTHKDGGKDSSQNTFRNQLSRVLRNKMLWIVGTNQLLLAAGISINLLHLPAYVDSLGIPFTHYPNMFLVYSVTFIASRIICGFIFNRFRDRSVVCMFAFEMGFALALGFMPIYAVSIPALFVYNFLIGVTYAPSYMLLTSVLIQYFGLEDLPVAFGINVLSGGIGFIVGPPLAGMLYDLLRTYSFSFYFAGTAVGLGASLLVFVRCSCGQGRPTHATNELECTLK